MARASRARTHPAADRRAPPLPPAAVLLLLLLGALGAAAGARVPAKAGLGRGVDKRPQGGEPLRAPQAPKVAVEVYYEALCPDCERFVRDTLRPALLPEAGPGLEGVVDLRLVPAGNAKVGAGGAIECQHGAPECLGNRLENCVLAHYPHDAAWPWVACFESAKELGPDTLLGVGKHCAARLGVDWDKITACGVREHGDGDALHRAALRATDALSPPHKYVPWVLVDGKQICDASGDCPLVEAVCDAYAGPGAKPPMCGPTAAV